MSAWYEHHPCALTALTELSALMLEAGHGLPVLSELKRLLTGNVNMRRLSKSRAAIVTRPVAGDSRKPRHPGRNWELRMFDLD